MDIILRGRHVCSMHCDGDKDIHAIVTLCHQQATAADVLHEYQHVQGLHVLSVKEIMEYDLDTLRERVQSVNMLNVRPYLVVLKVLLL